MVVPVTLLTGFLGSGKTTLINHLLDVTTEKLAIVENEFGGLNIDGALLKRDANASIIELSNGCVCCSVRGEFSAAMRDLLSAREKGDMAFNRIIVETTGLADPSPIIQTFFVDDVLREMMALDACVTLVDCEHIARQLDEHAVAAAQIGFADRILLSKTDRVSEKIRDAAIARIHTINNKAEIFTVLNGDCPPSLWLDLNAFTLSDDLGLTRGHYQVKSGTKRFHAFPVEPQQSWNDAISAHLLEAGEVGLDEAGAFMEAMIAAHGNDMLRYKGILAVKDEPRRLIVQGIHKVVGFDYGSNWGDEPRRSQLVIIGHDLPVQEIENSFKKTEIV